MEIKMPTMYLCKSLVSHQLKYLKNMHVLAL